MLEYISEAAACIVPQGAILVVVRVGGWLMSSTDLSVVLRCAESSHWVGSRRHRKVLGALPYVCVQHQQGAVAVAFKACVKATLLAYCGRIWVVAIKEGVRNKQPALGTCVVQACWYEARQRELTNGHLA
jgi:hypothetical protein